MKEIQLYGKRPCGAHRLGAIPAVLAGCLHNTNGLLAVQVMEGYKGLMEFVNQSKGRGCHNGEGNPELRGVLPFFPPPELTC